MKWHTLQNPVKEIAKKAGEMMLQPEAFEIFEKGEQDFVTEMDLAVNEFILKKLREVFPEAHILSEESDDHSVSLSGYTWVVDPIDGTNNFIFSLPFSCVSIGLLFEGTPVLGVVYNPYAKEMFYATKGGGAYLNGEKISVDNIQSMKDALILCETNPYADRTKTCTQKIITRIFQHCVDYRVLGAAALDICYVACGRGSALVSEALNPWDYTAGEIILREAGGKTSRWDNTPLTYEKSQTYLASNGHLHPELLTYVKK